ncbi:MAG: Crp/Fnr family transcriptional regulator [Pleurocapsa sp.]
MVLSIQYPPHFGHKKLPHNTNRLLCLLSESERLNLVSQSNRIFLPPKTTIHQPNEQIDQVYFPIQGIISLLNTTKEGLSAATATVSNEGMIGIAAFLGGYFVSSYAVVQTDCVAISLAANIIQQEFANHSELQPILLLYTQALLAEVSQNVLCSCHHTLEQRLARWLLSFSDRLGTNTLLLTQETMAELLGVRRSSLSVVASEFRQKNLIDYSRGRIVIQNPANLRKVACECDRLILDEYTRLFDCY